MNLKATVLFVFMLLLAPAATLAQDSKQQLNDQLWEAARGGDAAAVTALLDKGADVNAKFRYGATALFKAAERGNVDVVKVLLARGADATVKDSFYGATAMTWALSNKHIEVVRAILEKDATSVADVLMTGVREGNVTLVEVALAKGSVKPETLTAALVAAQSDKEKAAMVEMLKKAGAVPPPEIDPAILQSYAGKYKNDQGRELVLSFSDGKLSLAPTGQSPLALMASDKVTFKPTAFDGLVITIDLEGGKVSGFTLKQGANPPQVFKKVEEPK
ncbi:MAG TPA: ankyrin repeat domain-containing protein [Pyrinomonadaceae bacterium]|nr:ankyrin repeat domain-containing protein [Pyrinomonadaceae bacterium]